MIYFLKSVFITAVVMSVLSGCADNDNNNLSKTDSYLPINTATVMIPPDEGSLNLLAQTFDLNSIAYEDVEYFIEGTATAFSNANEFTAEGQWQAEPGEQAQYLTRIVVHRPLDPSQFSGTVMVEWLNVTSGFDIPPSWGNRSRRNVSQGPYLDRRQRTTGGH